ncbi:hypothetical protein BLA60_14040 [Actinophytocola xinjiangensis]|uniref:Low molecular weight protein antigen 6 PH domain-containing protein n=1 Tax=Actinophytocola xinjiangensis TaxID=485602 RepID=A0A7Z0WMR4_9PSEU|nr:PH domain-containing protein [Actinophytocola xinjiangensis]OLF11112.1 hypothetical protein BLA60_14040 [Actinophytocola xinjiangensis]
MTLAVLGTCTTLLGNATASSLSVTDLTTAAVTAALTLGFALPSLYQLWRLLRPRRRLQVSPTGLTVRHGRRTHHLPWSTIARTHITNDHYRPWLLVTPAPGTPPWELGPPIDGAYRAYPIAHGESRLSRSRQRADLRDALALHTPTRDA